MIEETEDPKRLVERLTRDLPDKYDRLKQLILEEYIEKLEGANKELKRLNDELERKVFQMTTLYILGNELSSTIELDKITKTVREIVIGVIGAKVFSIVIVEKDDSGDKVSLVTSDGTVREDLLSKVDGKGIIEHTIRTGEIYINNERREGFRDSEDIDVCIPLKVGLEIVGAFCINELLPTTHFDKEALEFAVIVANLFVAPIMNAKLHKQVEEQANTDGLTRLYTHAYFQRRLSELLRKRKGSLSLIMMDIDHFKKFNDTFGHQCGDTVLRKVASIVKSCVWGKDLVARYGGEEFAAILPDTDKSGAVAVAERMRREVENWVFYERGTPQKVTISLGVSTSPEDGTVNEELIDRADKALYKAKQSGRNRVCSQV